MSKLWRIHTTVILVIGMLAIIIATAVAFMVTNFQSRSQVELGSGVFQARVADSNSERTAGLSGVEELKTNEVLLMVFDSDAEWGIWMKDMKIPLDIVWLDKAQKVIYIVKNAAPETGTPQTFSPPEPARYVLEFSAGSVADHNINIGDVASFTLPDGEGE